MRIAAKANGIAVFGVLCVIMILAAGCDKHPRLVTVHGKITLAGKPVGPGDILFIPNKAKGSSGKTAIGHFEEDGQYVLTTYKNNDGVIIGHHTVTITPRPAGVAPGTEFPANAKLSPIPAKYGDPVRSPLSAEVQSGTSEVNFDLTP